MLDRIGVSHFQIRQRKDLLQPMDGLIIPGGESTAIGKLLDDLDMMEMLRDKIRKGLPVFGTCAGMILLAAEIEFFTCDEFAGRRIPMTFIRAPYIAEAGKDVQVLSVVGGHIVAARERNMLVCSFHPELSDDTTVHAYFVENMIAGSGL